MSTLSLGVYIQPVHYIILLTRDMYKCGVYISQIFFTTVVFLFKHFFKKNN